MQEKKRLSLFVPATIYDRLDSESKHYGITKTAIIQNMIVDYYRRADRDAMRCVSSGKVTTQGVTETP